MLYTSHIRQYVRMLAFAVLGGVIGALIMMRVVSVVSVYTTEIGPLEVTPETISNSENTQSVRPTSIRIPSVGIEASFEDPLGIQENNEVEVPKSYETVGYYKYGPVPGDIGPSVVLGHVDSYQGPAVLWSLKDVNVGDVLEIDREDGSVAVFEVEKLDFPLQSEFPTEEVYGDINYAGLRIITCSGKYDKGVLRYSNNLIVYAKLIEIRTE